MEEDEYGYGGKYDEDDDEEDAEEFVVAAMEVFGR